MLEALSPKKQRMVAVCRARLARLPMAKHPALRILPWQEGYRNYLFGARSGPSVQVSSLFHELGHAAQFGVGMFRTRATEQGFYFKVPQIFVYDRYCVGPKTGQATARELETFAYQLHLMRVAGCKQTDAEFFEYCGRLMRFMHDWWHIPGESDEERATYCSQQIATYYAQIDRKDALARLEAWLDATSRRWKRQKRKPEEFGGYAVHV